jgi:mannosylglycerate hydrolase
VQHEILANRNSLIHYAWKLLMECHPHDSICGTSIDQVANEMRIRFDQVEQITRELVNQCLHNITDHIDTRLDDNQHLSIDPKKILFTIVVFNPNDAPQTGLVNLNYKLDYPNTSFDIIDDHGNVILNDQMGTGTRELISMTTDKKSLKQLLGMIHEGVAAGMVIREFNINRQEEKVFIQATLSDHGNVDLNKWRYGIAQLELMLADPNVDEYIIHAYSDPEINLSIIASDIPGHGYRCYWIQTKAEQSPRKSQLIKLSPFVQKILPLLSRVAQTPIFSWFVVGRKIASANSLKSIENEYFKVDVRPSEGVISVTEKRTGQVYTGLNRFVDGADVGDLYNYCPPERDLLVTARIKKFEVINQNTSQRLIIHYSLKIPAGIANDRKSRSPETINIPIASTISVVNGVPRIDIHTEIENQAFDHRLRVHFSAPFFSSYSIQDGHFEIVERPIRIPDYTESWEEPPRPEVPQCQFTIVHNDHISLTIANRGLPEVEVFKNEAGNAELALTLLRCIGWLSRDDLKTRKGHAGPMGITTPDAQMIGKFSFDYSILPGDSNWHKSIPHAYSFNAPLKSITTPVHAGNLSSNYSFIENHNEDFIITAIKTAEDGLGLIVRGVNITSKPIELSLKPGRLFAHAQLVRLDEKLIQEIPISTQGTINLRVDGNKIATIRFYD